MACTTILVGKKASYDGSTMIARNDDSGSGHFTPKKFVVIHPEEQPKTYKSVISHVTIELPDDPMRYTAVQSDMWISQEIWMCALQSVWYIRKKMKSVSGREPESWQTAYRKKNLKSARIRQERW